MYRYIAVRTDAAGVSPDTGARLSTLGLPLRASLPGLTIYASSQTPVQIHAGNSVLIGHVFCRSTNDQITPDRLPASSLRNVIRYLIDECWGEYVLLASGDTPGVVMSMRDPSGGLDCLYAPERGFITSDISAAARARLFEKSVDWDFILNNLVYPHLKTGRTGFVGLHHLLPGFRLDLHRVESTLEQVWDPWIFVAPERRYTQAEAAQKAVRESVGAVAKRWAETDEHVLLELSGGLDSSIVAAAIGGSRASIACCNLITPVPGADEREYAIPMADAIGAELHVDTLGFENTYLDEPPPAQAVAPSTWFLQHASNALKASIGARVGAHSYFSGGGGDTIFGYTRTAAPAADAFRARGLSTGLRAVHDLAELHQCTVWKAGRLTARKLMTPPRPPRDPDLSFLASAAEQEAFVPHPWHAAPSGALAGDRERIFDLAGTQIFRDGLARSAERHLRMPLLSQPVVENCLRVPSWLWIAGGRNRAVARDAFADVLPPAILHRRSKGTFMNYSGAVFHRNKAQLREYLMSGVLASRGLLDTGALLRFLGRDLAQRETTFMRIFELCAAENWVRHQG
ncbi:asparagine synthase C-terminal domain-containing protein [Luteimonas sp. 3794]|uniref:asparagine synthase C-terminal domain-containing protein n=1 Tax=Luteimonas sp. 3794 TaxID=2817730 RepID=UPI00285669B3|nr:asparagine synthase C-terminal domain-containing protein [Luteimonas sp. 3794]MDR6990964.1 asparagine synthase (glutamine-hydrolyzing) [Luteimonas sp. 3794]